MLHILTVVGARPQFIKAAMVSNAFKRKKHIRETLVHTGQHYDANLSDIFFNELEIPAPDHHLTVGSGSHGQQTGQMLMGLEEIMEAKKPDWVLLYGDTNSTLAGALAASKLKLKVAHVEAGLRSFNKHMPEEINRVLTDHCSELLLAPTQLAVQNLLNERLDEDKIHHVGDVMFDAALYYQNKAAEHSTILNTLKIETGQFALATLHRAENTDSPKRLANIVTALARFGQETRVILPLHPRTRKALQQENLLTTLEKSVTVTEPLGLLDMIQLERNAKLIMTDSGGLQKEAFFYQVPCITLRDETEWVETIDLGWNTLCAPCNPEVIYQAFKEAAPPAHYQASHPYGDGHSSEKIAQLLLELQHID